MLFLNVQGLFVSGTIGDRLPLRGVLCFGMCSSSIIVSLTHAVHAR